MKPRIHWLLDSLLLGALLAAVALIVWLARAPLATRDSGARKHEAFEIAPPGERRSPPLSAFRAMVERPLFWPGRRPLAVKTPSASGKAGELADYALVGVLVFDDEGIALVRDRKGKTRRIKQGEKLEGWRLARLGRREAEFRHNGRRELLPLRVGKPAAPPPRRRGLRRKGNPVRQPRKPVVRNQAPHARVAPGVTAPKPVRRLAR